MRTITRLALAIALGLFASLAFVGTASAEGPESLEEADLTEKELIHLVEIVVEENGGDAFTGECAAFMIEGKELESCQEAPNQLLPETNEIIWGGIGFLIVFLFLAKFGFPAIKQTMNDRTESIRADLEEAENAKVEAQGVLDTYKAQLADAKSESGRIIEEARQQADQVRRDQESKLQTELADMRTKAVGDIEASKAQVMGDLQSEVAALAIGAAEIVVEKNLDQATQVQLIENYINQVNQRS